VQLVGFRCRSRAYTRIISSLPALLPGDANGNDRELAVRNLPWTEAMPVDPWFVEVEEVCVDVDPEAAKYKAETADLLCPRLGLVYSPAFARVSPSDKGGGVVFVRCCDDRIVDWNPCPRRRAVRLLLPQSRGFEGFGSPEVGSVRHEPPVTSRPSTSALD
jgi:hypothetical protein